jgi:soluble P-type ATPase
VIEISIPGHKQIRADHLVLDYNGTLAVDGKLIPETKPLLEILMKRLSLHVITADTFGDSQKELEGIPCNHVIIPLSEQDVQKERYVTDLGSEHVVAIGNGQNDALMLRKAVLAIMVIQQEGAFGKLFNDADIVCSSIHDALNLLLNPLRIIATLRK